MINRYRMSTSLVAIVTLLTITPISARMVTDPHGYFRQKLSDISGLGQTGRAAKNIGDAATDLTDSVVKDLTGDPGVKDKGGFVKDYQNSLKLREAGRSFAEARPDLAKDLASSDVTKRDAALQIFNEYATREFGVLPTKGTATFNGDALKGTPQDKAVTAEGKPVKKSDTDAFYDKQNQTIALNDKKLDDSTKTTLKVAGHELDHHIDQQLGLPTTEPGADRFGEQIARAVIGEIGNGQGPQLSQYHELQVQQNQVNGVYTEGNVLAGMAEEIDPKTYMSKEDTLWRLAPKKMRDFFGVNVEERIVAVDGINDGKVVVDIPIWEIAMIKANGTKKNGVIQVSTEHETQGTTYDLNVDNDKAAFAKRAGMNYEKLEENPMIVLQNGVQNSLVDAEKTAKKLEALTGMPVGIINNPTEKSGVFGLIGDLVEYGNNKTSGLLNWIYTIN